MKKYIFSVKQLLEESRENIHTLRNLIEDLEQDLEKKERDILEDCLDQQVENFEWYSSEFGKYIDQIEEYENERDKNKKADTTAH